MAGQPTTAVFATAAYGLGSIAFPFSTVFFGHQLAAAALFGAYGVVFLERRRAAATGGWRPGPLLLAGFCAGWAAITEFPSVPVVAALGVYLLVASRRAAPVIPLVAGAVPPMVMLLLYQWASFGHPFELAYAHVMPQFAQGMSQGLAGVTYPKPGVAIDLLFGLYRGLIPLSPVLLLAVPGFRAMWRFTDLRLDVAFASAVSSYFVLFNASYVFPYGGASLGPRYLIPMLPFLCLPIAFGVRGRWAMLGTVLLIVSVIHMLAGAAINPRVPEEIRNTLTGYLYPGLFLGRRGLAWNWGLALGLPGRASLLPLLTVWLAAGGGVLSALRAGEKQAGPGRE